MEEHAKLTDRWKALVSSKPDGWESECLALEALICEIERRIIAAATHVRLCERERRITRAAAMDG